MAFDDYEDLLDHIDQHAPDARLLKSLSAAIGGESCTIWLDGQAIWHAWEEEPDKPGSPWNLEQEPVHVTLGWIKNHLCVSDQDEDTLAELYDVELAAIPVDDPRGVDAAIRAKIQYARAEVAHLAGLRVHHIVDRIGGNQERGWQTRAARTLGISEAKISGLLAAERDRQQHRRNTRTTS